MAMYEIHENKMWQYGQLSMNVCMLDQLAKLVHVICCTIEQCLSRQPVKDIVRTMHQFKHEHHLCIAHTLEGTCTACPVVAYSHEYTVVASKGTKIEMSHWQTDRLIQGSLAEITNQRFS